ncbi:class III extradiol ring-cleavage dioxygenase [uncultured Sneathiella sp.]|uniref:DODA-type extradiol aromatic ring-opening family dioxygenase n=1 Tax=uncultured Sneathiella sp. TaxID=879315 RepID=UPI0030DA54DA
MSKMPTVFVPHGGGPCFFMDWDPADAWDKMAAYLHRVHVDIGQRPKAIVVVSGHWEEPVITVQSNPTPPLLFDYYGFPEHTYKLEYAAPGSPELASRIKNLLLAKNIQVKTDSRRGFDHGVFIPLKLAFPDADIPIVQLSLRSDLDPAGHIAVGEALQPLRDEGVLIIGSGMSYHNMQKLMRNLRSVASGDEVEAESFDQWLTETIKNPNYLERKEMLADWEKAPFARDAHPTEEHLMPLFVVVGAAGIDTGQRMLKDTVLGAVQSAYQFG